jgi:hypothetical protein
VKSKSTNHLPTPKKIWGAMLLGGAFCIAASSPISYAWGQDLESEETEPGAGDAASGTAIEHSGSVSERGLSWDALFGGIPKSGNLVTAEIGFSQLPRVAYHHTLSNNLSIGGMFAFDYGYFAPDYSFNPALVFAAPIRWKVYEESKFNIGVRADPGISMDFDPFIFGILLNIGASLGYQITDRVVLGGGIDLPMAIGIPTGDGDVNFSIPMLFGPMAEFHITPPLALTADFKMGPHISTSSGPFSSGTVFGLRALFGVAYRL